MLHKFTNAFKEYTNRYMERCAENTIAAVYVDMVRGLMEETPDSTRRFCE